MTSYKDHPQRSSNSRTSKGRSGGSVNVESPLWDDFPFWLDTGLRSEHGRLNSRDTAGEGERRGTGTTDMLEWDDGDVFVESDGTGDVLESEEMSTQFWV